MAGHFIEEYKARMKAAADNIGNPLDKSVALGPLANKAAH